MLAIVDGRPARTGLVVRDRLAVAEVATQTSPNVLAVPSTSPELSDPANRRPCRSQASTGSPLLAVRMWAFAAYGEVSPG